MYKTASLICAFLIIFLVGCQTTQNRPVSPDVQKFFGEKILGIIMDADKCLSYRVKPEKTKDKSIAAICGYPVINNGPALSASELIRLKKILLDEKTYDFKYAKKAFVFPDYAFVLFKGNEQVSVLFDFYRKEVLFVHEGKELVEDFDNAEKDVRDITDRLLK